MDEQIGEWKIGWFTCKCTRSDVRLSEVRHFLLGCMTPNPPCIHNCSLVPRLPHSMGERQSGTVASNSWSKRQMSFPLKKDVHCNEHPF